MWDVIFNVVVCVNVGGVLTGTTDAGEGSSGAEELIGKQEPSKPVDWELSS